MKRRRRINEGINKSYVAKRPLSATRLSRGRIARLPSDIFMNAASQRKSGETMTSLSSYDPPKWGTRKREWKSNSQPPGQRALQTEQPCSEEDEE